MVAEPIQLQSMGRLLLFAQRTAEVKRLAATEIPGVKVQTQETDYGFTWSVAVELPDGRRNAVRGYSDGRWFRPRWWTLWRPSRWKLVKHLFKPKWIPPMEAADAIRELKKWVEKPRAAPQP